ncbi:MAG: aldo/keto reductase [Chthoniobacterales bacterium]
MPASSRYDQMKYRRCGNSGLLLPAISLGFWHGFGEGADDANAREMALGAFDLGITHFDLANNYGTPPGSAEITLARILRADLASHRDELVISTKAGFRMGPGPYGDGGSRKYLLDSLDQSLTRLGLDHVDVFYHHRPDSETPLEESMTALADAVRSGKSHYVGISNYPADRAHRAAQILRDLGVPLLIHQPRYNIVDRRAENEGLLDVLDREDVGAIAFCPLAQGLLTDKYLNGIPSESRAASGSPFLKSDGITDDIVRVAGKLNDIARARGQSLAQMAIAWTLRKSVVVSALIGASRLSQIEENVKALSNLDFTPEQLESIDHAAVPAA